MGGGGGGVCVFVCLCVCVRVRVRVCVYACVCAWGVVGGGFQVSAPRCVLPYTGRTQLQMMFTLIANDFYADRKRWLR